MKMKLVPWIQEARGKSGDTVFREVDGETVVASKPGKRKTPSSGKQVEFQDRFLDARDYYTDRVKRIPALLALYEQAAEQAGKSVYMMCRRDWYQAPEVRNPELGGYNGQVGDIVGFKVRNVIPAARAIVTLTDGDTGALIERGQAEPEFEGSSFWQYTATQAVPAGVNVSFRFEVYDYPGNSGEKTDSKRVI